MSRNVMLRDFDVSPPHSSDGRRLEVMAKGLCMFGECQLALDATVVSTLEGRRGGWSCAEEGMKKQRGHSCVGEMRLVVSRNEGLWWMVQEVVLSLCVFNGKGCEVILIMLRPGFFFGSDHTTFFVGSNTL